MRPRPVRRLNDQVLPPAAASVYGSTTASRFLRDLFAGTDSLDIVTVGDSNSANSGYGYTAALQRVLGFHYGIDPYATPLLPCGHRFMTGAAGTNNTLNDNTDPVGIGTGFYASWDDSITIAGSGPSRMMGLYTGDTNIDALKSFLNFDTSTINTNTGPSVPQPNQYMWLPVAIPTGSTFGGNGVTNYIRLRTYSPLLQNNTATNFSYRVQHGTWATGSGQFKLRASNGGSTTYAISGFNPTNTGAIGYATTSLPITNQTAELFCTWDGGATPTSNLVTGPFVGLWHSVIRTSKLGYSVTNFTTSQGRSTEQIADRVENVDKGLDCFLSEIRNRQIAAGGSGRVLVFVNSGVNSDNSTTWQSGVNRIVSRMIARWTTIGGSTSQLAFVFTLTAPMTSTYTGSNSAWKTSRAAIASAAQSWASANTYPNVSYVEIETTYPAWKIALGCAVPSQVSTTFYSNASTDQVHLTSTTPFSSLVNGYEAISGSIISSLLASS